MSAKKLNTNLIRTNCYISEVTDTNQTTHKPTQKKYHELRRTMTHNGLKEELVEVDYPITADSVKSYEDSCDYRIDPVANITSAPKRKNLGDITGVQEFTEHDQSTAHSIYERIKADIISALKKNEQAKPVKENNDNGTAV